MRDIGTRADDVDPCLDCLVEKSSHGRTERPAERRGETDQLDVGQSPFVHRIANLDQRVHTAEPVDGGDVDVGSDGGRAPGDECLHCGRRPLHEALVCQVADSGEPLGDPGVEVGRDGHAGGEERLVEVGVGLHPRGKDHLPGAVFDGVARRIG